MQRALEGRHAVHHGLFGGPSPSEGKSRAEVGIVNRKVARRARTGQTFPPCPSYSRRRDRNNCVHWRSLYKGGGGVLGMERLLCNFCGPRISAPSGPFFLGRGSNSDVPRVLDATMAHGMCMGRMLQARHVQEKGRRRPGRG